MATMKQLRRVLPAIGSGDVELVRQLLTEQPELKDHSDQALPSLLHAAAKTGNLAMLQLFLEMGFNINKTFGKVEESVLFVALLNNHIDAAKFLLSRGADPNLGRTLFDAIHKPSDTLGLELTKLLVEHGADVNRVFNWFGDDRLTYTPLTFAIANGKTEIANYLRSKGAVVPGEEPATRPKSLAQEIVAFFEENFGPVKPQALIEIVPTLPPIAIHVVPPKGKGKPVTLFTTGMSEQHMTVPEGHEDSRYAEIFIELPGDWPLAKEALANPNHGWPIHWLRSTAKYPHENKTWLGGPVTIIANDDPPQPLAPNSKFTSLLLVADESFTASDGRTLRLYRMVPLYTEERDMELREGFEALLRAFERHSIPLVVDLNRINVAKR